MSKARFNLLSSIDRIMEEFFKECNEKYGIPVNELATLWAGSSIPTQKAEEQKISEELDEATLLFETTQLLKARCKKRGIKNYEAYGS